MAKAPAAGTAWAFLITKEIALLMTPVKGTTSRHRETSPHPGQTGHDPLDFDEWICDPQSIAYEDLALLAEAHRLVGQVADAAGGWEAIPAVSDPAWNDAPPVAKIAALLVLSLDYLIADPSDIAWEMLRDTSKAISSSGRWAGCRPSHAELVRRRAEPGREWPEFDAAAAQRWVETGSSERAVA